MDALNDRRYRWQVRVRRTLFFGLTFLTAGAATALLLNVLEANGVSGIEVVGLVLFFGLFTWIAGALWTAIAGFAMRLAGRDPLGIDVQELAGRALRTRTAVVVPIYNEDPVRVGAGLTAVWSSLARESEQGVFDLFILSDTSDERIAADEEKMWQGLVARYGAERVFYRRRLDRSERKAGNIADFVRRWGANYECMVVLDADSVMSGHALVTLARAMEAHPRIGILQSLPLPEGRETLFGRLIQFGSRLQSPMLSSGLRGGRPARATTGATMPSSACCLLRSTAPCRDFPGDHRSAVTSSATTSSRPPSCAAPGSRCGSSPSSKAAGKRCRRMSSTTQHVIVAGRRATCSTPACWYFRDFMRSAACIC